MNFALISVLITAYLTTCVLSCGCEYEYATKCAKGPTVGATRLAEHFKSLYGGDTQIFNCRNTVGGQHLSLHAEGRAVDLFVTGETGRKAFDYAVEIACTHGIQEVIFNKRIWTNAKGERDYTGANPHTDHVHIGLNKCGAKNFSA